MEGGDGEVCVVAQVLMGACASALFAGHSALGVHACELGYGVEAWVALGVARCAEQLRGGVEDVVGAVPVVLAQARRATLALTRATTATVGDPLLVGEQITEGLAHLLAISLLAVQVLAGP